MADPESSFLSPIDEFIENESVTRFDITPPIHLLNWEPLHERIGSGESPSIDVEELIGQEQEGAKEEREERERKMIEAMWGRLKSHLERDGYQTLREIESRLETYKSKEAARRHLGGTKKHAVKEYKTLLKRLSEELGADTKLVDALRAKRPLRPRFELVWETSPSGTIGPPVGPDTVAGDSAESSQMRRGAKFEWQGILTLSEGYLDEYGFPKEIPLEFCFDGDMSLEDACRELEGKKRKWERVRSDASDVHALINFRLKLLRRFLWSLEVSGGIVPDPTPDQIPDAVDGHGTLVEHACCILQLRPLLADRDESWSEKGVLPTQKELKQYVRRAYESSDVSSPNALVEGATTLVREHMFEDEYDGFRDSFYHLLFDHDNWVFRIADRLEIDPPSPNLDIED